VKTFKVELSVIDSYFKKQAILLLTLLDKFLFGKSVLCESSQED